MMHKNYRESIYNISIVTQQGKFIWNLYSGCIIPVEEEMDILMQSEDVNRGKILEDCNFIVLEELDEASLVENEEQKNILLKDEFLRLTIMLTNSCNYNCSYCYQGTHGSKKITNEVIESIVSYVQGEISRYNYKGLRVNWYGGEPLLCVGEIKKITGMLMMCCKKRNISYKASIVTNGSLLLNLENDFLKKNRIFQIQITLDGLVEYYTSIKKTSAKNFELVIGALIKYCEDFDMRVRINYDGIHCSEVYKIIEFLLEEKKLNGKIKIYIAPLLIAGEDTENQQRRNGVYWDFLRHFVPDFIEKYGEKSLIYEKPIRRKVFCSSSRTGTAVIDYQGRIFNCSHDCSDGKRCRGKINEGTIKENQYEKVVHSAKCKKCSFFPVCLEGCTYTRLEKGNVINCEAYKMYMQSIMTYLLNKRINENFNK